MSPLHFVPAADGTSAIVSQPGFMASEYNGRVRRRIGGSARYVLWRLFVWFNHFHALVETGRIWEQGIYALVFPFTARKRPPRPAESRQ
jgi:hypothetical protein